MEKVVIDSTATPNDGSNGGIFDDLGIGGRIRIELRESLTCDRTLADHCDRNSPTLMRFQLRLPIAYGLFKSIRGSLRSRKLIAIAPFP